MILGTGTDIIEVERVRAKIQKENGFREAIFSGREIEYCECGNKKFESYAARFAAKEAFLKALGMGIFDMHEFSQIEIINNTSGKPEIFLSGKVKEIAKQQNVGMIHVTLSHIKEFAIAMVIIESKSI